MERLLPVLLENDHLTKNRFIMQKLSNWQYKRTPARDNPLNTDFNPGGEQERWPEDPEAVEYNNDLVSDPDQLKEDPNNDEEQYGDMEDQWEDVVRTYKIY